MHYKINDVKVKQIPSLGKSVADLEVVDISGAKFKGSMWSDFPSFPTMTFGAEFDADMVAKEKNGYLTNTFYAIKEKPAYGKPSGGFKGNMQAVVAQKNENIKAAQDNKEFGIKVSSTMRDAVSITLAHGIEDKTPAEIQDLIEYWRKYLWLQWDKEDKDYPPFN